MSARWNILYRGPLSSCNYACGYCPFAKTRNTREELRDDAAKLERFLAWVEAQAPQQIGILFTPWGEALGHRVYQQALLRLGEVPHVRRAAIQTNLSGRLDWLERANRKTLALWCTFHPTEVRIDTFVRRIQRLQEMGIRHSVGVVGMRPHFAAIRKLRDALPPDTYLWVNAFKRDAGYYLDGHIRFLEGIDPHFALNLRQHPSMRKSCAAGHTAFTVDGEGEAQACHFLKQPLGNIYSPDFASRLSPRRCSAEICGCHIGYVHMKDTGADRIFGENVLERIPLEWAARQG